MKNLLLALVLITMPLQGFAKQGTEGGGGGVTAEKDGKRYLLDLIEKDELEHFNPEFYSRKMPIEYYNYYTRLFFIIEFMSRKQVVSDYGTVNACSKPFKIENSESMFGSNKFLIVFGLSYWPTTFNYNSSCTPEEHKERLKNLLETYNLEPVTPLRWAFTDMKLESLNDEGLIKYNNPASKRQVAIQKDGLVVVNKKEFLLLNAENREALFIHELVLRTVLVLNPNHIKKHGTQYIREYVRNTMKSMNTSIDGKPVPPAYTVNDSFKKLGID